MDVVSILTENLRDYFDAGILKFEGLGIGMSLEVGGLLRVSSNMRIVTKLKGHGGVGCHVNLSFDPASLWGDGRRQDWDRIRFWDQHWSSYRVLGRIRGRGCDTLTP
jgi:hypothetical protein